ncbi:MAG: DUF3592 domain-containing protein [Oscillospiraceae bacterium]|jgi:Protein of unknown function (DUF3592).|nr:DUF3592 domain-containing protein [Oscillospiraceae bacterium]
MENKIARFLRNTGPARFFVPLGIILIVFGIILLSFKTDSYLETVGKVTEVYETRNAENSQVYDVTFTFNVDGKEYTGVFDELTEEYKVGDDIKVFYNPEDPTQTTNSKLGGIIAPVMIGLGAVALVFGVFKTVKAFQKSKELDRTPKADPVAFEGFKQSVGVTEYYCRHDGVMLKPGYILEDAARKVLFEGKMTKQALVGARIFEFSNHVNGGVTEHEVGHTMTQSYDDNGWTAKSWFKFDGKNVWDELHDRGIRLQTNMRSKFPNFTYEVSKDGQAFAILETSGKYVHEDEAAEHKLNVPVGRYYYRVWTNTRDFETLFLTIFAISETEQAVVE